MVHKTRKAVAWPMRFYLAFTGWIVFVAAFVSPFPAWSFSEINSQWLTAFLALYLGVVFALAEDNGATAKLALQLFLSALVLHVLVLDGQGLWLSIRNGGVPEMARLTGLLAGPGKGDYITNFVLDACIAELSLRIEGKRFFVWPKWLLLSLISVGLVAVYFEAKRNDLINLVTLLAFCLFILGRNRLGPITAGKLMGIVGAVSAVASLIVLDIMFDSRWDTLFATIPIALAIHSHTAWLDPAHLPLPRLPNGTAVNGSNYLRIAWIRAGVGFVIHHPLGIGYGRSAFGHAMRLQYGAIARYLKSSNDTLVDTAVGTGVVGIFLWLAWLGSLALHGWRRVWSREDNFWARFILLLVLDAGLRSLVDSNLRNYTLSQFAFLIGLAAPLAVPQRVALATAEMVARSSNEQGGLEKSGEMGR